MEAKSDSSSMYDRLEQLAAEGGLGVVVVPKDLAEQVVTYVKSLQADDEVQGLMIAGIGSGLPGTVLHDLATGTNPYCYTTARGKRDCSGDDDTIVINN